MRKIKNVCIELMGAALFASAAAGTALAAWPTGDYGGKNVTGGVMSESNKAAFLPAPGGDAFVVWTMENQTFPLTKYDVVAQRLAGADGSYVWPSTMTLVSGISRNGLFGPDLANFQADGNQGMLVQYADSVSSNCYVASYGADGNLRWGASMLNSDRVSMCAPSLPVVNNRYGFVFFATSSYSSAFDGQQGFIQAVDLTNGGTLFGGNGLVGPALAYDQNISIYGAPSPAGGGQVSPGAIFVYQLSGEGFFRAFRADNSGNVNWTIAYSTIAASFPVDRNPEFFVLPDGQSGVYVVWADSATQDIKAVRVNANGVVDPAWPQSIDTNMYLNVNYGGVGNTGAFYAAATSTSGPVVAWAEDVTGSAQVRAALFSPDGLGLEWNSAVETIDNGGGFLTFDGNNLKISVSTPVAESIGLAYQYGNSAVDKALNAAVLDLAGAQTILTGPLISNLPVNVSNHDAFIAGGISEHIAGVMISSSIYAQKVTAGPPPNPFSGDFSTGGPVFDGGAAQLGLSGRGIDVAVDTVTAGGPYVYTVGLSSAGYSMQYVIARYAFDGVLLSTAGFAKGPSYLERPSIAVGPDGSVYVAADVAETPFTNPDSYAALLLKYTPGLTFVSSATYQAAPGAGAMDTFNDIAADSAGIYVTGSFKMTSGSADTRIVSLKYAPSLSMVSSATFDLAGNGYYDNGNAIVATAGDVYVAGQVNTVAYGSEACVVLRYTKNMTAVSSTTFSSGNGVCHAAAAPYSGGALYVAGDFTPVSNSDSVVVRYDSALVFQSSAAFDGGGYDIPYALALDGNGYVYAAGRYDFDAEDAMVLKYSPGLALVSTAAYTTPYTDIGYGLAVDDSTNVYMAAWSNNGVNDNFRTLRFGENDFGAAGPSLRQISGTSSFAGAYGPSSVLTVWVSTSPDFRGFPYYAQVSGTASDKPYVISNVPAGIYYLAMTASINWQVADSTDPWGVHGQLGTPTPIDVTAGDAQFVDVTMTDGNDQPNPWSPETSIPAIVSCASGFAGGGNCRINGFSTYATAVAADPSNNRYLAVTNLTDSAIVKFNPAGVVVSSITVKFAAFNDIKVNPANGNLYVAAQGPVSGIRLYSFTPSLALVSSMSVAGYQGARQLDFSQTGGVYAVSTIDNAGDYDIRLILADEQLSSLNGDWNYTSPGPDQGYGVHVDGLDVFVAGVTRPGVDDEVMVLRYTDMEGFVLTGTGLAFTPPQLFAEGAGFNNIRVASDQNGVYAAYTANLFTSTATTIYRFDRSDMSSVLLYSSVTLSGADNFADLKSSGTYLFVAAQSFEGQAKVAKLVPSELLEISSGATAVPGLYGFGPGGLAFGPGGQIYLSGVIPTAGPDMGGGIAMMGPLADAPPSVVYISTEDVSPAVYLVGQEAAALKITPYTLSGSALVTGLGIAVNPAGPYSYVSSVGLYADTNETGSWDDGDALLSSSAVTGSSHVFGFSAVADASHVPLFLTLVPAASAEGNSLRLSVPSSAAFVTAGGMAAQSVYPAISAARPAQSFMPAAGLTPDTGINLTGVNLSWTYPQAIASGHFIIRYSTNPADLGSPNNPANRIIEPLSGVSASQAGSYYVSPLTPVVSGLRVYPHHFAVWLFNGASTSAASNLAQNIHFPAASAADGDSVLNTLTGASVNTGSPVKYVRAGGGRYYGYTFSMGSYQYVALRTGVGQYYYTSGAAETMELKDLVADQDGAAYGLLHKSTSVVVAKFSPAGDVLWTRILNDDAPYETAKALVFGVNAVYAATEFDNAGNQDFRVRKLAAADGSVLLTGGYDSSALFGYPSSDQVNALAFAQEGGMNFLYASGASGENYNYGSPMSGRIIKFADTGTQISTAAAFVPGNWPVVHNNPYSANAAATDIKVDFNGNLVAAGYEYRYDLNQGANVWLNRYSPYGSPLFSSPARYNNSQSNWDDVPTGLDFDNFGNIYVTAYSDMWNLNQGYNLVLLKFAPGGFFLSGRVFDAGGYYDGFGSEVLISTDNYAGVTGVFGVDGNFGVYSVPLGASANTQFFTASEGPYAGSADLAWNYTGSLPAGSTYYIQYRLDASTPWNRAAAQVSAVVATPQFAGTVQSHRVGALQTLRYPGGGSAASENRGNLYGFKVWITSAGVTTELPEAQTYARTPSAYDNTQYFGRERLSYMSGLSRPSNAVQLDGQYVYHAFAGTADGVNAGFGLRKYNADQYLEWTKFFNHHDDRAYYLGNMTRDAYGNFFLVGSQDAVLQGGNPYLSAGKDIWIAKLNSQGDLVWSYSADASGTGRMDELYDAAVEGDYLYVVGVTSSAANGMDLLARKYDVSGAPSMVWNYTLNGSGNGDDFGYGVSIGTGAVYLAGTLFNSTKDMAVRAVSKTAGAEVGALIQTDSGYDDEGYDLDIATTTPPYLYLGGSMGRWELAGSGYEAHDASLLQYRLDGTLERTHIYNGKDNLDEAVYAVKSNGSGVIAAGFESTGAEGKNAFYRKFTHAGETEWSRGFNFSGGMGDDEVYGLATDSSGRVYSAVSVWDAHPGFYYFPEPSFAVMASPNYVPGSVRLDWMSQHELPAATPFSIQYSTYSSGMAWDPAAAQVRFLTDSAVMEGMNMTRAVYGLTSGRDAQGNPIGSEYYFRVWFSTTGGIQVPVAPSASASRPGDGWSFENMSVYPNEARLFSIGNSQQYYSGTAGGEKEFPGLGRGPAGSLYSVANMDWNGNGGFALKKFSSAFSPLWTMYYTPGEWFQVKANRIAVDASAIYITGYERDPMGVTGKDIFVMKMAESGVVWKSTFNFAGNDDVGYGIALDAGGNVFVAGSVNTGSGDDAFLAKYSPAGVLLSTVTYNGSDGGPDFAYGVAVQGLKVYAAGSSYEAGKGSQVWLGLFGPNLGAGPAVNYGGDNSGAWAEAAYDVLVDSLGYVYAAAEMYSAGNYSVDAVVFRSTADLSSVVSSSTYNSQAGGSDAAYGLTVGPGGAVYAVGYTERYDVNQDRNLWLRKLAADGSELWTQEFHSNAIPGVMTYGPNSDEGYNVLLDSNSGFIMVSGRFGGFSGVYRYRQSNILAYNPTLTVTVSSAAAAVPFPGVGVALIPFSATGGLDPAGIRRGQTDVNGVFSAQIPAGKQYFIALDKQGYNPGIKDQQMDPYGNFFVQLDADLAKNYTLFPRPAADPYYPLTVTVTSATAGDYVMAEVFFTQTGEKSAYGISQVPVGRSSVTFTVSNLPPASAAGVYTLGVTIPNRGLARSVPMNALFPQTSAYAVIMSTMSGAIATTGGFDVGASTTPASVEGVVRNLRTQAPVEQVRIRLFNRQDPCMGGMCEYNSYETLTDVNGKYSFYNVVSTAAQYNVVAQKAGYKRGWREPFTLSAPNLPAVYREFQLEESTYSLRGYVRYRDVPIPNADVMVWGDYNWYGATDSYRNGVGMDTDARTKTGADGSFVFSTGTLNALPDGQLRMSVAFMGTWMELNEGNNQLWPEGMNPNRDPDDVRIVISSQGAAGAAGTACRAGRVWKLDAQTGACEAYGDMNFNIMPPSQNDFALLSGSITFVTSYTVTAASPLVISSMAPITVMAMQECNDCKTRSMGFSVLSGTYTVNYATYSITLSTGLAYYTRITSNEWGEVSSFDDRADFRSTTTTSVRMNFVVTKAGRLKGVVKMPDGSNYKPNYNGTSEQYHRMDVRVSGQNVSVDEGWGVDEYGEFDFPNLAPGLYTVTMRPQGDGFRWAAPAVSDVAVVAGKTTQVTMKLENGLFVQPQIIGLPEISTPTWAYIMIPVPSGTEMDQDRITDMFFSEDVFSFEYSTATQTWQKKIMQVGQYDFYLMMGARYNPDTDGQEPESYDQFGNFIGKVKSFAVQRNDAQPNLGTEVQPISVNVLGSLGQETFEGTIVGERLYTDADLDRVFSNFNELFPVIPAVMIYDAAGDLRGYTAALPTAEDFELFEEALESKDKAQVRAYFADNKARFMVSGLPPGRYTVVFNNPNYPPMAKEIDIPLAASYGGIYPFDFDAQQVRVGSVYGTVRSTATGEALDNAVVYLKHKTVEKFTTTAADGSFAFDNLPSGIYRVEVTREGYVKTGERTSLSPGASSALSFYMTPTQSNMTGKVYLSKFPAPLTKSGVKIVAYDETYNVEHPTEYLAKIEATTNDSGEYELTGIIPGHTYKVSAFYTGKLPATLDVSSETVTEGTTYLPDIVMREVPPQITVKVRKSPDSASKVDVTIKSPKQLVTTPVCRVNPGEVYLATSAVSLALVPAPNNTYIGQFTVSRGQDFYNVYVAAGDGSNRMEKNVTYSPTNQAKTEQYIQSEAIQGGEVQMDKESEEYSGIELDAGGLAYSTYSATASQDFSNLVGGFFSALPSVRTVKTAKGDLSLTQAIQDLMASEIYNMNLDNAQANKPFTLTLKYDKDKAADNANLRIYQQDADGNWNEVPGDYTVDPMLGVLSVGVASLTNASEGTSGANTPLGRKRFGMSAVVNGRYVPSASSGSQSGRFAVFTAKPGSGVAYSGPDYEVYNLPNPFNLKDKTLSISADGTTNAALFASGSYVTRGTLIKYHLPSGRSGRVKFVIYNAAGEKVRTIDDGSRTGGEIFYSEWDGKNDANQDCASGVYFMLTYVNGEKLGAKAHKLAIIK